MSENKPHVVLRKLTVPRIGTVAAVFPTYADAFKYWKTVHTWQKPWVIHTLGRECTVTAEVVDVAE